MVYCVHRFIRPAIYVYVFLKTLLQYALVIYPVQTVSSIPATLEQTFFAPEKYNEIAIDTWLCYAEPEMNEACAIKY